jgi:hypothetical protein
MVIAATEVSAPKARMWRDAAHQLGQIRHPAMNPMDQPVPMRPSFWRSLVKPRAIRTAGVVSIGINSEPVAGVPRRHPATAPIRAYINNARRR